MAWRLEKHDEYIPEDWGVEPIRLVDDEGETVADNVAFYPHALTREHADAILAMQAQLAAPSPSPAPGVVEALRIGQSYVLDAMRNDGGIENCEIGYRTDFEKIRAALASLSQPAKGEREGEQP